MQQLTQTLIDAIRSDYQKPIAKIEIYNRDGSMAGSLSDDVLSFDVDVDGSRKVKRITGVKLDNAGGKYSPDPDLHNNNLFWYNKSVKVWTGFNTTAGDELIPAGEFIITDIQADIKKGDIILDIKGSDKMSLLWEDKFDDVYVIDDAAATVTANYALSSGGATIAASSYLNTGDEIQQQGRIHSVKTFATINGIQKEVTNGSTIDPKAMISGSTLDEWLFSYIPIAGETVTQIEAEIFLDLKDEESLQQINIVFSNGAVLTDYLYYSPDNATWSSSLTLPVTPSGQVRFVKFKCRKTAAETDGSFILGVKEIQTKTNDIFNPGLAIDGDSSATAWRPKASDASPQITVTFAGSYAINSINLFWGSDPFDFESRVKYYLERSADGVTYTRITDLNGINEFTSNYGDVEHVITEVSFKYLRIRITGWSGSIRLRHIEPRKVTATLTYDVAIRNILTAAGIPTNMISIPLTRKYVTSRMAEIGTEKADFIQRIAASAGWDDVGTNEAGIFYCKKRDINPVDLAWEIQTTTDNIFEFSPMFSNDVYNVIVAVYSGTDQKAIVARAIDDNPLSPTYIGSIGRRVLKYENEWIDTQDKADRYAQQKLFERTRLKHSTAIPMTGHPAMQIDDVVSVTVEAAKIKTKLYVVTGFKLTFAAKPRSYEIVIYVSQL